MIFTRSALASAMMVTLASANSLRVRRKMGDSRAFNSRILPILQALRQLTSCPAEAAVTSCFIRDLDSGAEQEITNGFVHTPVEGGRYSIRCDVEGALEHSKWHFNDEVSDDWRPPFWMKNNDDNDLTRVWDVDFLTTCGDKSFTFEAYVWGIDEPCASKTVSFQGTPCLEVTSCSRVQRSLSYAPSVPAGTTIETRDPVTKVLVLSVVAEEGATTKQLTAQQARKFGAVKPNKPEMRFVTELGAGPWFQCSRNTPIGLDIDGSGSVERIKGNFFLDISGDGNIEHLHEWFAPSEGILLDAALAAKDGLISAQHFSAGSTDSRELQRYTGAITGKHLFGDMGSLFADGFKKLEGHDANKDGHVEGSELAGLAVWVDQNSNAKVDAGEISTLSSYGIVGLNTDHSNYVSSAQLKDGSSMVTEDLWLAR